MARRRLPTVVAATLLALLAGGVAALPTPAAAAGSPTVLTVTAASSAYVFSEVDVTATLTRDDGRPLVGAELLFEQRHAGRWARLGARLTDGSGSATLPAQVRPNPDNDRVRVTFAGTDDLLAASGQAQVRPVPRRSAVALRGPKRVVDERAVRLRVRWRTDDGRPVAGRVVLRQRAGSRPWRRFAVLRTGADGTAALTVRPRRDTRWRAVGRAGRWWQRDASRVLRVDNVPPGRPVSYPRAAPRPRVSLPRPQRAVGRGPNAVVRAVPGRVWRSMVGRS